ANDALLTFSVVFYDVGQITHQPRKLDLILVAGAPPRDGQFSQTSDCSLSELDARLAFKNVPQFRSLRSLVSWKLQVDPCEGFYFRAQDIVIQFVRNGVC